MAPNKTLHSLISLIFLFAVPVLGEDPTSCSSNPIFNVLSYGEVVTCKLPSPGASIAHFFIGSFGERVFIQISDGDGSSPFPIAQVELLDPIGFKLGGTTSSLFATLSFPGPYSLLVTEAQGDQTFDYTLVIEGLSPRFRSTPLISFGSAATSRIDPIGDADLYYFTGAPGQTVFAQISYGDGTEPFPVATLTLFDPSGIPLQETTISTLTQTLSRSGRYTLLVNEGGFGGRDDTTDYTLALESLVPPSSNAPPLCYGCTETGSIDPVGDIDLFRFAGGVGDVVHLNIGDGDGSAPFPTVTMELFSPFGVSLATSSQSTQLTLASEGTYTVVVSENNRDQTTNYTISLQCLAGRCVQGGGDPQPPPGNWLTTPSLPGYRVKALITTNSNSLLGTKVDDCTSVIA